MQLVINAGSSSLKWALFTELDSEEKLLAGMFDRLGPECVFRFHEREERVAVPDHAAAVDYLLRFLDHNGVLEAQVTSVVHRVVHGGEKYHEPVVIDDAVEHDIENLSLLAPLHNPANLAGIRGAKKALPDATHIAVFDTAFHHTIKKEVFLYGLPLELYEKFRIRKYGFHGISHQYLSEELAATYGRPVSAITCHLGAGSSVTAINEGRSADTTMGFTPLDGLLMATRSGELDPEIPLFLLREGHYSPEKLQELLEKRSGLLGLTGHADLRDVHRLAEQGDEDCRLAIRMLSYRVAYYVNAMRTAVPRPRALVFAGGVGEGADYVRKAVCDYLRIPLDRKANAYGMGCISTRHSPLDVWVLHTDEQVQMHRESRKLLKHAQQ